MAIRSEDGWINPAHVVTITGNGKNKRGIWSSVLHLTDGTTCTAVGDAEDLAESLDPVVQAIPGFDLLTSAEEEDGSFIELSQEPILAWRIGRHEPAPITASRAETLGNPHGIRFPDGIVMDIEEAETSKDAEAWLRRLNKRAKHKLEVAS